MRRVGDSGPSVLPRIALTLGDPAGIGPELAARILSVPENLQRAEVHIVGHREEVEAAAKEAGVHVRLESAPQPGAACVVPGAPHTQAERGAVSRMAGERAIGDLLTALDLYRRDVVDAIMFVPLNKSSLRLAGMHEEDELRWFAKQLRHNGRTSELNVVDGLWTARVTSHIPMKEVAGQITARAVTDTIHLLHSTLRDVGLASQRIAVCALNPHAGENGNFGTEEIDEIDPGVRQARADGLDVSGPFPADTLFIKARAGDFDGVVTMYHDQGQIALKTIGFDRGVTVQGGLPVPIATPSSGTAFEIVGKGIANPGATQRAFDLLIALAERACDRRSARQR